MMTFETDSEAEREDSLLREKSTRIRKMPDKRLTDTEITLELLALRASDRELRQMVTGLVGSLVQICDYHSQVAPKVAVEELRGIARACLTPAVRAVAEAVKESNDAD